MSGQGHNCSLTALVGVRLADVGQNAEVGVQKTHQRADASDHLDAYSQSQGQPHNHSCAAGPLVMTRSTLARSCGVPT